MVIALLLWTNLVTALFVGVHDGAKWVKPGKITPADMRSGAEGLPR